MINIHGLNIKQNDNASWDVYRGDTKIFENLSKTAAIMKAFYYTHLKYKMVEDAPVNSTGDAIANYEPIIQIDNKKVLKRKNKKK